MLDADRDQEEELVYNEQRRTTVTMDDSLSLNSVSINLNTTKDNLLDQSITSDPTTEERSVMENILLKDVIRPSVRPPSPPLDLPPPPPQLTSPISTTASPSKAFITLNRMAEVPDLRPPPVPPPPPPPSTLFTIDNKRGFIPYDRSDQGMSSPPNEPPPPIEQSLPAPPYISGGSKSGFSSHEDLLSEQAHSRSTVREIPVLRTPSAAPSQQSTVLDFRMPTATSNYPLSDVQDEYYRREVMTRTVITRSTEALSQQPPLGRSSPIERYITYPDPNTREERTFDYKITYHRNVEDEERRIREDQDRRRKEEEDRRRREEENRRAWELREREVLEHLRLEREKKEKEFELSILERERAEKERIERDRLDRERIEMQRRAEWERMENERRGLEESDLARKRQLEKERLEIERAEEERKERERLERERERLERERIEAERREQERLEKIRIERERIERERIEVERIERIKREKIERERREREREREEQERLQREREELERIERERRELEIREREMLELQRREAEERERQRIEDEAKEVRRREEERREAELLADIQRQAEERERLRRLQEREEHERLERIRREQQRVDLERAEAERRERERLEEERREKELLDAQRRKKEQRERERLEDQERERLRQEEERKERERRELERRAAAERERQRKEEEERERLRIYELERAAATRRAQRQAELERERERDELDKKAREVAEMERREAERRERERLEEERSLSELREKERRNQEIREKERIEAAEREAARRLEDRRSRDKLDYIVRERTERERFEAEKRRLLTEKESMNKKRHHLTSSETLQKLTRPPYFSRENLNTEVTTKVERQVIERVDRNVWVDEMRYPSSAQQAISYSLDSTNDENTRDRIYNPRENDLARNGSTRTSRYRAKMEKARRDFITGTQESTDPLTERFRKSTEDLLVRGRPEYRGPLLQKFHDGEFKSKTDLDILPYSRVGPSQYGQVEETNLDDVYRRSGSVVDYHRQSRRDQTEDNPEPIHTRSRSADYLMDRKTREESEPPENQLQKTMGEASPRNSRISEHELRFRKSTEKLTVPDWYRENRPTVRPTDVDLSLPRGTSYANASSSQYGTATIKATPHRPESPHSQQSHHRYSQPFSYTSGPHNSATQSSPGGFDIPRGMFDRYKDEIENLRKSRTSLHHLGQEQRQEERPSPAPRRSLSHEAITTTRTETTSNRALPGYTVSEVPNAWNVRRSRSSRVVEVADTFVGPKQVIDQYGNVSLRYGGRVTIEEVLDSIFQQTSPTSGPDGTNSSGLPMADNVFSGNINGPGIYTKNYMLMDQVIKQPERAGTLLKSEDLFVRCAYCHKTKEISQARMQFVTCKHCYTYYCKRECRSKDWIKHGCRCSFARINTLCKDVIMKVREDQQAQTFMSRIAREGFSASGRGSVNIRLSSPQLAQAYVTHGWIALANAPLQELLHYYTIASLLQERKEPSLIALCKRYDPREKFILSVSIIADIEHCPQTPPPETVDYHQETQDHGYNPQNQNQSPNQIHFAGQRYPPYMPLTLIPTDV